MNMIQIGVIGVIGALLSIQFKGGKSEYGIYMSVAISILIFACIVVKLELFVRTVSQVSQYIKIDTSYLAAMLKMIGITYIAEFSSSVCKDAGYQTIAIQIEIFSKLTILALGLPVLLALLETIREFWHEVESKKESGKGSEKEMALWTAFFLFIGDDSGFWPHLKWL